jgi:hypothetical protein
VVESEDIFHGIDELSVLFGWDFPVAREMRFRVFFLTLSDGLVKNRLEVYLVGHNEFIGEEMKSPARMSF